MSQHRIALQRLLAREPRFKSLDPAAPRSERSLRDSVASHLWGAFEINLRPDAFLWDHDSGGSTLVCVEVACSNPVAVDRLAVYGRLAALLDMVEIEIDVIEIDGWGNVRNRWGTCELLSQTPEEILQVRG